VLDNARVAARIAVALAGQRSSSAAAAGDAPAGLSG